MFEFLVRLVESEQQRCKILRSVYEKEQKDFFVNVGKMPEDPKSRVNYWMAYAIKSIAGSLPKIPSKENPIKIKGPNPLEAQYVWTSFMLLGSILPAKFDHHSIWVLSANGFEPRGEIGYFSRFSSKSLYETAFKHYLDEAEINTFLTKASLEVITRLLAEEKRIVVDEEHQRQREQLEREKALAKTLDRQKDDTETKLARASVPGTPVFDCFPWSQDTVARIKYSMAFVYNLLESLDKSPTKKDPIVIGDKDPDKLPYIWTACVLFGKHHPTYKFGREAVVANKTKDFDPQDQLDKSEKFSKISFYKTVFEHYWTPDLLSISDFLTKPPVTKFSPISTGYIHDIERFNYDKKVIEYSVSLQGYSKNTLERLRLITEIFSNIPQQAEVLSFNSYIFSGIVVSDIVTILATIPKNIKSLSFSSDLFAEMNADSIKAILDSVPKNVTKLKCYGAHCLLMFPCIPRNFISIEFCVNSSHIPDRDVGDKLIQLSRALPRHLSSLNLNSSNLGGIQPDKLIELFQALPPLKSLNLTYNFLYKHNKDDLIRIFNSLPTSLFELDLRNNGGLNCSDHLMALYSVLPPNIEVFNISGHPEKRPSLSERQEILEKAERVKREEREEHFKKINNQKLLNEVAKFDGKASIIDDLIADGADINYQAPINGYTPLMCAIDGQNERVAEYLLRLGADPSLKNKYGRVASDLASSNSVIYHLLREKEQSSAQPALGEQINKAFHAEIISDSPQIRKIKKILKDGANINYQDEGGYTALMLAVDHEKDRIVEYLLKEGADPLLKNKECEIASELTSRNSLIYPIIKGYELMYSIQNADLPTVKKLVNQRVDIEFCGANGYTPLLMAVKQESFELVKFLLDQNANPASTTDDGVDAFSLTTNSKIQELLNQKCGNPEADDVIDSTSLDQEPSTYNGHFFNENSHQVDEVSHLANMSFS
ncbi:ankyrin repeat domain-containing protein [Legionella sp.]|uniref:ankyrin repeat domain-containing protein n=1 Tax=Legionella sp. TaxID=459 RepID=UPI003CA8E931